MCIRNDSQISILILLLQGFNSSMVSFIFPYSCLSFNMRRALDETWLFVFMYLICSLCLIPNDLPVCPTHELLQVLHFNLYISLEFVLFWFILSPSCLSMVMWHGRLCSDWYV